MKITQRDKEIVQVHYKELYGIETDLFNLLENAGDSNDTELKRIWSELFEIITFLDNQV